MSGANAIAIPLDILNHDVTDHDYSEDFSHENGRYCGKCPTCKSDFMGHKRRFICRKCQKPGEIQQ